MDPKLERSSVKFYLKSHLYLSFSVHIMVYPRQLFYALLFSAALCTPALGCLLVPRRSLPLSGSGAEGKFAWVVLAVCLTRELGNHAINPHSSTLKAL